MLFRPLHLLLACCAFLLVAQVQETKAQSAQERILTFALDVQIRRLRGQSIPDQTISASRRWKIRLSGMSVTSITPPGLTVRISGDNINVAALNGALSVRGNYRIYRRITWSRGNVQVDMSGININAQFRRSGNSVSLTSCTTTIGNVNVRLWGRLIARFLNLFSGRIADRLKPRLQTLVCQQIGRAASGLNLG